MATTSTDPLKRAAKALARPLLQQFEAIHERFDRLEVQLDERTAHLTAYVGKIETEMYQLRTQVSVDVEVIAELSRILQRILRELEPVVPEIQAMSGELRRATAEAERQLTRAGVPAADAASDDAARRHAS